MAFQKRKFYSDEEWIAFIRLWMPSGLSARRWCREKAICYTSFLERLKRLKNHSSLETSLPAPVPPFVELSDPRPKESGVSLEYEGFHIHLSNDFDHKTLTLCLKSLKESLCYLS